MSILERDLKMELYEKLVSHGLIHALPIFYQQNKQAIKSDWKHYNKDSMGFNLEFLRSEDYLKTLKESCTIIPNLPIAYFATDELWTLLENNVYTILAFHVGEISEQMYNYAIGKDPMLFAFLGQKYQTMEIAKSVIDFEPLLLEFVRDDLRYYWLCENAVKRNWQALKFVPTKIIDQSMIDHALAQDDSYLLDILPNEFLTVSIYSRYFDSHPTESLNTLIKMQLNEDGINDFIENIEASDSFKPEIILRESDPKLLYAPERNLALAQLINLRPHYIHYLDSAFIAENIFEIALTHGELPWLTEMAWSPEKIDIAYKINKKAFKKMPISAIPKLGKDRIKAIVETAINEEWVSELPNYFFKSFIIEDEILNKKLIYMRPEYSMVLIPERFEVEWLNQYNFSVDELVMLNRKITGIDENTVKLNIEAFVLLNDNEKSLILCGEFLKLYPEYFYHLPQKVLENNELMKRLLNEIPKLAKYLPSKQTFEILRNF